MDERPKDYSDPQEWFLYFRITKSLEGFSHKFKEEMERAPDIDATKVVLTSYAAATLDILLPWNTDGLAEALNLTFELTPGHLLGLSVPDITGAIFGRARDLEDTLKKAGFTIEGGIIADFQSLTPVPKNRPTPPKPGGF